MSTVVNLFGGPYVVRDSVRTTRLPSRKAGLLLAYLALRLGKPQSREQLVDLFWPDSDLHAGLNNLSTMLSWLRRDLGAEAIKSDRSTITLSATAVETDVQEFERLASRASNEPDQETRIQFSDRICELAEEDLLPNITDEWAESARFAIHRVFEGVLTLSAKTHLELGNFERSLQMGERLLRLNPYSETAIQAIMSARWATGEVAMALNEYERFRAQLWDELAVSPGDATERLLIRLRDTAWTADRVASPHASALPTQLPKTVIPFVQQAGEEHPVSRISRGLGPLYGRIHELNLLHRLLTAEESSAPQLVTLLGFGGIGKTRLAIELGAKLIDQFEGRVYLVRLETVLRSSGILDAILKAVKIMPGPGSDREQLLAFLGVQPSLLILDNLEHLLEDESHLTDDLEDVRAVISDLLSASPNLKILATSRKPVCLDAEKQIPIPPLELPDSNDQALLLQSPSVALFLDRARRVKGDFALTDRNAVVVKQLCRRLEGVPLSLEMAAAWVKSIPPANLLKMLERQLDVLVSKRRDLPLRQLSMRASCEWSFGLLSPALQDALVKLCLYRNGFSIEAAEANLGSEAFSLISELVDQSFVVVRHDDSESVRYHILESIGEFGREKLAESGNESSARASHAHFYLRECPKHAVKPWRKTTEEDLRWLDEENENILSAIDWLMNSSPEQALLLTSHVVRFWEQKSNFFITSRVGLSVIEHPDLQHSCLERALVLRATGAFHYRLSQYEKGRILQEEATEIYRSLGEAGGEAECLHGLSTSPIYYRQFDEARSYLQRSLSLYESIGLELGVAACSHSLGNVGILSGNLPEAEEHLRLAKTLREKHFDDLGTASTVGALALLARVGKRYSESLQLYIEVLTLRASKQADWILALTAHHLTHLMRDMGMIAAAVRLASIEKALRMATGFLLTEEEEISELRALEGLRDRLGPSRYDEEWNAGKAKTPPELLSFVRSLAAES